MSDDAQPGRLILDSAAGSQRLAVEGDWTLPHYAHLLEETARLGSAGNTAAPDWSRLGALDTAGASLLARALGTERLPQLLEGGGALDDARRALLATVGQAVADAGRAAPPRRANALLDLLSHVGGTVEACWRLGVDICGFLGLTLESLARTMFRPHTWRVTATVAQIEQNGFNAVPIVLLLTFLVGAVVAFLGATVLANFGASIFTVQLVGFSFLREFGAMLTAILIAGRTASAFTAQIGSMKANEEIDAIRAIGLDPINLLVLPRVLALLVSLPVLTFLAMLSGILGGMVVCALSLDISPTLFWNTLEDSIRVRHFFVGMAKALMFAMVIGVIGCLEGMKVDGSAQSVGEHTTSSVVQCIFMVILIDALVALLCMEMGLVSAPENVIEVRGLVNRFGPQVVHDRLDLDIRRGEILGVVGGSGTGKSVLLRSIVGLLRPFAGRITVFGQELDALAEDERSGIERRMGVLFQRGALFTSLTTAENTALPLIEHAGLPRAEALRLAQVKLAMAGLPADAGDKFPAALSGGMIKRAALARALALDPDILFLDEPTAGLDPIGASAFDRLIRTLRDSLGFTVFLVTHDLDTLYAICDRVAVLAQRRVLAVDKLSVVAQVDDPWVRDYFQGPRGRAAATTARGK